MKINESNLLSLEICREAIEVFLCENVVVEKSRTGVAMALPLMYPHGLQVQVVIEPLTSSFALITDHGETLQRLKVDGLSLDGDKTKSFLHERMQAFELVQYGLELQRVIPLPLQGIDIQLFAESLVSIAHLAYRIKPAAPTISNADKALCSVLEERNIKPKRDAVVDGHLEKGIKISYLLPTKSQIACKVVKRRGPMLNYMEQWGWRWGDVKQNNPTLIRGMIYDPDTQGWDDTALNIGRSVCDLFCPYFEAQTIHDAIDRADAAQQNGN